MNDALYVKRIFDILSTIILLVFIWPIFLIIGFLVYITAGSPIFFLQDRIGLKGKPFKIIKFRTMINNAVKMGDGYFVKENDERITRVGRILRKYSLDEIGQLINILKGDMSVVGPRPPLTFFPYRYNDYKTKDKRRFDLRPGLTGYAQILYRNEIAWEKRFIYDIYYVNNYSFWLDLIILLQSVLKVNSAKSIYGYYSKLKDSKDNE